MTKVQTFDATRIMHQISVFAPFFLMMLAFMSFFAVGVFWVDYYSTLFKPRFADNAQIMAILIALIQELVRFGLLVASVRDFMDKKPYNGWLGLVFSIGIVWHDVTTCKLVSKMWDNTNSDAYSGVIMFLIFVGLVLEIRLVLTMNGEKSVMTKNLVNEVQNTEGVSASQKPKNGVLN